MALARAVLGELEHESQSTIRMLERVPGDKLDWTPHAKSMTLGRLAWHLAGIPARAAHFLSSGTFDLSAARPPQTKEGTPADIVEEFRRNVETIKQLIGAMDDEAMKAPFSLTRNGETLRTMPMAAMIRSILLNHSYHHRGQLSVYLRLLDVPVPATYGTSADEMG
jgi:uncharacterized damage-inducible protein DinB